MNSRPQSPWTLVACAVSFCVLLLAARVCAEPDTGARGQIEIDASFIAFAKAETEVIARRAGSAAPSATEIKALWRSGSGRLLSTAMDAFLYWCVLFTGP